MSATWLLCENGDSCPPATMHAYPEVGDSVTVESDTEGRVAGFDAYVAVTAGETLDVVNVDTASHQIIARRHPALGEADELLWVNLDDLAGYTDE